MNTYTRLILFIVTTILSLIITACKPKLVIGPEQTFAVDVPSPAFSNAMNVTLEIAVPQGGLALAGGTEGLIEGTITYNAADYEPHMTSSDNALLIRQSEPGPKSVVVSVQNDLINQWDLSVGDAPMDLEIRMENGEYTIEFAKSMPADFNVTINAGVGKVNLLVDPNLAVQVIIGEHTDLLEVTNRGDWIQTSNVYETASSPTSLTVTVNMRGGELNLERK